MSGVQVKFSVSYNHVAEEGGPSYVATPEVYGTTNSSGGFTLSIQVEYATFLGLVSMSASVTDSRYVTLSASGNYSTSGTTIYPSFTVMHDEDGNGISDEWEVALAKKFCPNLTLHSGDQGVRPVPVEIMDRNGDNVLNWQDVIVDVYTEAGQLIGYFSPSQIYIPEVIYKDIYPYYHPQLTISTWIDTNNDWCFSCVGDGVAPGNRVLYPHFEWGPVGSTTPSSWYSTWNAKMTQFSSDMRYIKGTTYAHLFKSGSDIVIQYWFFYPFNACAGRHEGDWEHINVIINNPNPSQAQMTKVVYYYHDKHEVKTPSQITVVNQTHPKIYVGGRVSEAGMSGEGSHGSYWRPGNHEDINILNSDEYVDGQGLVIDFNNYSNVIILPKFSHVNNRHNNIIPYIDLYGNNLNWMIFNSFWGYILSEPSAGYTTFTVFRTIIGGLTFGFGVEVAEKWFNVKDVGNIAPVGPVQHVEWEEKGY